MAETKKPELGFKTKGRLIGVSKPIHSYSEFEPEITREPRVSKLFFRTGTEPIRLYPILPSVSAKTTLSGRDAHY